MTIFHIPIPDSLNITDFDLKMLVASKLFEDGKLSSGQASEIVGISKRAFIEILGRYNVSLFGYDFDELEEDLRNA
ncbi:MAG: UPF0175 family protein [Chitinophagales bacterium]